MKHLIRNLVCLSIFCVITSLFSATVTEYDRALEYLNRKGEVYFRSDFSSDAEAQMIASNFVVDYFDAAFAYLYADKESFQAFTELNKWYEVLEHPGDYPERLYEQIGENERVHRSINLPSSDAPYSGFENMVKGLETDYPDIIKVDVAGTSTTGKKIYSVKVSSDPDSNQCKPLFIGTGTMHGDEPTGFMCILYLIDWLGKNYGSDQQATDIVDKTEMHFIPLVNPSGSYNRGGNYGSQVRRTPNCTDINRSFPSPPFANQSTQYPNGDKEGDAMQELYETRSFGMGMDLHTGMTSIVLPWSCTGAQTYKHPDFTGYLMKKANNFISAVGGMSGGTGWAYTKWYPGYGTIFDYSIYHGRCRCFCLELGSKSVTASSVLSAWNKYKPGFLYFLEEVQNGIHGVILCGGDPVKAKLTVDDHDKYNSEVFSDPITGYLQRPIEAGTYSLTLTYEQYTVEIEDVKVEDNKKTDIGTIEMSGTYISQKAKPLSANSLSAKIAADKIVFNNTSTSDAVFVLYTVNGSKVKAFNVKKGDAESYALNTLSVPHATGIYVVTAKNKTTAYSQRITIW